MKKTIALMLITVMLLSLTACSSGKPAVPTLNVYNWGDYIGEGVIEQFEKEFGCKVNYEMFDQNEDMYTKISKSKGSYDVVIPSDYMIEKMISEDMLAPLNKDNIPNLKNMSKLVMDLDFDKGNVYSVPYMWGTVGIVYNKTMVKAPLTSWEDLWDKQYAKQIFMINSVRDSMAVALKCLGLDPNTRKMEDVEKAKEKLIAQKDLVLAYTGDEVKDKMISGEAAMAVMYSGDAVTVMDQSEDLAYVVPKEGTNLWFDNMCILKDSKNKELAEKFINFMCSDEICEKNREYINYCTPNQNIWDKLPKEDLTVYPSDEVIKKSFIYLDLGDMAKTYDEIWTKIMVN